jgi:peptidoglycan/xylan/chitin deacetylase (PgdA/CDA1 family)
MAVAALATVDMLSPAVGSALTKTGTAGADKLIGTVRSDVLLGVAGNDTVSGKGGADELSGGPGSDKLTGGPGADTLLGGPGTDELRAKDGAADTVNCGAGAGDVAIVDEIDEVSSSCEQVEGQTALKPTPQPATPAAPAAPGEMPKPTPEEPEPEEEAEEPGYDGTLDEVPMSNVKVSAGWTGTGGTFSDQAGEPFEINGKTLRIQTNGAGGEAVATSPQFEPVNLKRSHVSLQSRLEFAGRLDRVRLRLASEDEFGTNYAEATVWQEDFDPIIQRSTFEFQSIPRGEFKVVGDVDWGAIDRAQIILTDNTLIGPVTLYVAGLYSVKTQELPTVSFAFDDGRISTYNRGMRELAPYRFPATAYVIADSVGKPGMISLEQLHTLQKQHHWEIAGHAMHLAAHNEPSGLDSLEPAALETEMDELRAWLTDNGFPRETFAYPKGAAGPETRQYVRRDYCAGRATAEGPETIPPRDPYTLRGWSISKNFDEAKFASKSAEINAVLDGGVAAKAWTILTFHDIVDGTPTQPNDVKTSEFAAVAAHVKQLQKEGKVRVVSIEDALEQTCH